MALALLQNKGFNHGRTYIQAMATPTEQNQRRKKANSSESACKQPRFKFTLQ